MELAQISYRYDLVAKILTEISYSFTLTDILNAPEETEPYLKRAFGLLEAKLEKNLPRALTKEPRGTKTESYHCFGYEYTDARHSVMGLASLKYAIFLRGKEITSATLNRESREDDDAPYVLSLYDELTTLPDLTITPGAKGTMAEIQILRQEPHTDDLKLSLIRLKKT